MEWVNRKIKCTGERPICQTCQFSGCAGDVMGSVFYAPTHCSSACLRQCSWRSEPPRGNRSREYVQSLLNKIKRLEGKISYFKTMHEKCRNEHGGFVDDQGPDLQSAEDEDAEEDLLNNNSDNEEDLAREFHVSAVIRPEISSTTFTPSTV